MIDLRHHQHRLRQFFSYAAAALAVALLLSLSQRTLAANVPERPANNGFLFSIEKANRKSYLLGTLHGGLSDAQLLGENILSALQGSDHLFVEADISDEKATNEAMNQAGLSRDGPRLRSLIGERYFNFFGRWFVDGLHYFSLEEYERVRPWLLVMLTPVADPKVDPLPSLQYGTETQLLAMAKQKGMPVGELEGLRLQIAIFDAMSPKQETEYFLAFVDHVQDHSIYRDQINEINTWTKGDFASYERMFREREKLADAYSRFWSEKLIRDRNRGMSEKIARIAGTSGRQFFAIGSLHLPGPNGVLARLKKAGFVVTQLR